MWGNGQGSGLLPHFLDPLFRKENMQNYYGGVGKKLNILIYDFGLFFEHARRLAQDGHSVRYFTPFFGAYPKFEQYAPGLGFEDEGVEKVMTFFDNVAWADLICFFDVGTGDIADYLRVKNPDKAIFGSSLKGDRLENNREFTRKIQEKIGLPVQESEVVKGISALREYLKKHPDKYVKLDIFRGDMDSFEAKSYPMVEGYLDQLEVSLGPFNEIYNFLVEDKIEGEEPGFDLYYYGKGWVKPMLWGIEQSKESYVGIYTNKLPKPLALVADKIGGVLQKLDYRGAMSIEARVTKEGKPYLIDICSRYPAPLSALYTLSIENYSEVIYKIAKGEEVTIKPLGKYVAAMPMYSNQAETNYIPLEFPQKYAKYVKFKTPAKVKGQVYGVKGSKVVYVLVACGDDWKKLIYFLEKLSGKVDAFKLSDESLASLKKIEEKIAGLPEYGLTGF
ncbi:MAG TPA: hypothetical protein VK808_05265 [Bacteroidia bacterium]|jgi:hypothetical protein|nr:hypothetical protein [Bacteroidia bacterium]